MGESGTRERVFVAIVAIALVVLIVAPLFFNSNTQPQVLYPA